MALFFAFVFTGFAPAAQARIWFVDNSRVDGDGSRDKPLQSIAGAASAAAAGDVIYVFRGSGPYRESVTLRDRQLLVGAGFPVTGIEFPPGLPEVPALPLIDGAAGSAIVLASGSHIAGLRVHSGAGHALDGTGLSGQVSIDHVEISVDGGIAVSIEGGDATILFDASPIAAAGGAAVVTRNRTGGELTFRNGSSIAVTRCKAAAIALTGNRGPTTFADPLLLNTDGACALCVKSSDAITISDATIAAANGPAVDISDTAVDVYVRSLSFDGGGSATVRGVSLENAPGSFRIQTGTFRNAAGRGISIVGSKGVTLQNIVFEKGRTTKPARPCSPSFDEAELECAAAIFLRQASDVALKDVKIENGASAGIFGELVSNLSLEAVTISGAVGHGMQVRDLSGHSEIIGSTFRDNGSRQIFIRNRAGEGTLEVRKSAFDGSPPPNGQQAVLVQLEGEARFALAVDDSDFAGNVSDALHAIAARKAQLDLVVNGSRFSANNSAVNLVVDDDARAEYRITGNTAERNTSPAISISANLSSSGSASGTIAGNTIGRSGVAGSGAKCGSCSGIFIAAAHAGKVLATIRDNTIQQVDGWGVRVQARGAAAVSAVIRGNAIREPHGAEALNAIGVQSGTRPTDPTRVCVDISGNRIGGMWDPAGDHAAIAITNKTSASIGLAGQDVKSTGKNTDAESVAAALAARNGGAATKIYVTPNAAAPFSAVAACF